MQKGEQKKPLSQRSRPKTLELKAFFGKSKGTKASGTIQAEANIEKLDVVANV